MGCMSSIQKRYAMARRKKNKITEILVFVPALRVPLPVDLLHPLSGLMPGDLLDRLCFLRSRILLLAQDNELPGILELQRALEAYLPVLCGLTKKEIRLEALVEFKWKSIGDDGKETCLASAWYKLLSVIHMMAVLLLLEANLLLIPNDSSDDREKKVSEVSNKVAIDLLLKASGCLDYCIHHVLIHLPPHIRKDLPKDLQEGVLEAISIQALAQAHYCLSRCKNTDAHGKKFLLFIKYKCLEAKASAYHYHGLVLGKRSASNNHTSAVCCHLAANELLMESKRASLSFCLATPVTRVPPFWGVMKHLHQKILEVAFMKSQMYKELLDKGKAFESLPDLPEFPLSLRPDEYNLPDIDTQWDREGCPPHVQTLKKHLRDEGDDMGTE